MLKTLITTIAVLVLMTGCATQADVDINNAHYGSLDIHNEEQTEQLYDKGVTIGSLFSNLNCNDGTESCGMVKALAAVLASDRVAAMQPQKFTEKKALTGLDVQKTAVVKITGGIPIFGMATVAYKAQDSKSGPTTITADNGSTVTTERTENHATTLGDESPSTLIPTNSGDQTVVAPEESEEEIVEEIPEDATED